MRWPRHLSTAARVTVLVVAPLLLFAWVKQNPSSCVRDYDLAMAIVAGATLVVSLVPFLVRVLGPRTKAARLGDAWMLPDLGLVTAMLLLLLFMRSGLGRMVVYDGCGIIAGPDGVPTTSSR